MNLGDLVSREIDYELNRYDAYMWYSERLFTIGLPQEASVFEALADLCYEKVALLRRAEHMAAALTENRKSRS